MEKMPRYVEIDYSKYAPDIPVEEREADLQAVREKYMPAAKGGEKHE